MVNSGMFLLALAHWKEISLILWVLYAMWFASTDEGKKPVNVGNLMVISAFTPSELICEEGQRSWVFVSQARKDAL